MKHICYSFSAYESLSNLYGDNVCLCVPFHLSIGNIIDPLDMSKRVDTYKLLKYPIKEIEKHSLLFAMEGRGKAEEYTIWATLNYPWEYCGFLFSLFHLDLARIFLIDTTSEEKGERQYKNIDDMSSEELRKKAHQAVPLSKEFHRCLIEQWKKLKEENAILRAFDGDSILSKDIDFYDEKILKKIPFIPQKTANILAEIIAKGERMEDEVFLASRIAILEKAGLLNRENFTKNIMCDYIWRD